MATVELTEADTNYNLHTLLQGVEDVPNRCQMLQIQFNAALSSDLCFIGNPDRLSESDYGVVLADTQAQTIQSVEANLIVLSDIAVRSNGAGHTLNVIVITR